ncbi:hypothetical protein EIP91_001419 [Steccherinum ochraceum]|uniref:INO80 complex subunit B-like conserved region domain-containing protein n=1 Tax=Steccherinum ochraceum TaxID=92696 RepID=A0A4R0RDY1_9APHY|nr:hypothetical protein EIP91_001419 [Steccherinum ochraceum]
MARKIIMDEDEDDVEDNQSEMQVESEDEVVNEGEVEVEEEDEAEEDVDVEEEDVEGEGEDEKEDELEEEEDEPESELDALSSPPPEGAEESVPHPKLKIKLKLGMGGGLSTATTATPTPEVSRAASRRGVSRDDIESEDSDDDSAAATPGRALTARQAVLRNVVDSSHVSLIEPPNPRKKPPLTEIEIALKREETARKRKNLSEKKLEDEKVETINRLLKKQSRAKGRRNALATAEDRDTPIAASRGEAEDEDAYEGSTAPIPVVPTMYRWVSSVKALDGGDEKQLALSFSVPVSIIPEPLEPSESGETKMDVESVQRLPPPSSVKPACDVSGCEVPRKYRLVKDWKRGACGMEHLKVLEAQVV